MNSLNKPNIHQWVQRCFQMMLAVQLLSPSCAASHPVHSPSLREITTEQGNLIPFNNPPQPSLHIPSRTPPDTEFAAFLPAAHCGTAGLTEPACAGVRKNDDWEPVFRLLDGVEMVLVPAGCFRMGNDHGLPHEKPRHAICVDRPFWIDRCEVTTARFAEFLTAHHANPVTYEGWLDPWEGVFEGQDWFQYHYRDGVYEPMPGHEQAPAESITFYGAQAYCRWRGGRLPTEAEWEFAARGPDSLMYPWGNEWIPENAAHIDDMGRMPDVGSIPQGASWVGALDLSSSLYEWTSSIYAPYPYRKDDGREAPLGVDPDSPRVLRGGSWYHMDAGRVDNLTATARFRVEPHRSVWPYGFRCVREVFP